MKVCALCNKPVRKDDEPLLNSVEYCECEDK